MTDYSSMGRADLLKRIEYLDRFVKSHESVFLMIAAERMRQDSKWGPISDRELARGDGVGEPHSEKVEREAKRLCETAEAEGRLTWAQLLFEEVTEVLAATGHEHLREELIQVAALAVKWIEVLDMRAGR